MPDAAPESSTDAPQEPDVADSAPVVCVLHTVGQPLEVFSIDQDLHTPSLAVLDPGTASTHARVALQAVAGGIRLISLTVHDASATGMDVSGELFVGQGSTYGQMTHAAGPELALVWGADGPGNLFRTVDIPSWTLGPLVQVSTVGWTPNGLAAGKGVVNTQSGQYEGDGYGMTWQTGTGSAPFLAVLSPSGNIQVGPLSPCAGVPGQMLESSISWSGSTYLIATRLDACSPGDPLCVERSVVVSRLRVAPGSNSIELASVFTTKDPDHLPGYPTLDGTTMVWQERAKTGEKTQVVHLEQLQKDGSKAGPSTKVSEGGEPALARPFVGSKPLGKVVGWASDWDISVPDDTIGRSILYLQEIQPDLTMDTSPIGLPITRFSSMGWPAVVSLANPRGVLLAWSARSLVSTRTAVFASFLPCGE